MGSELTRDLANAPDIEEVMIGECDIESAERMAAELGEKFKAIFVDVTKIDETAEKIKGYDVMMNCTFFDFFDYAIRAAAKARVNYADLISEPTPEHYQLAADSGILAISGLGATPGLTNVLAKSACDQLDQPEEIRISWCSLRTISPSPGLLGTIVWELANECATRQYFMNGKMIKVPPFEGSHMVKFADPVGEQIVYYVPHTETVSLSRNIKGVKYVCVQGTWRPETDE